jgi:FAD/FMN-containing dehydrogenase
MEIMARNKGNPTSASSPNGTDPRSLCRRSALKGLAAAAVSPILGRASRAQDEPLPKLPTFGSREALLLRPSDRGYALYQPAYNARVVLRPRLRVLCKTAKAVATMVDWARGNGLAFALRSGGHSYEGFSQSADIVIDTRLMNAITYDAAAKTMIVGAGATLRPIYEKIGAAGFGFPGGSCPSVGIAGHALGGGYGLIARAYGLACDNLEWVQLVDAQASIIEADANHNPDLFWACRGGGGGSFGAVTQFRFRIHKIARVLTLGVTWDLPLGRAAKLMSAWQAWAPQAPPAMTVFLRVSGLSNSKIRLHAAGQSVGSEAELRGALQHLFDVERPVAAPRIRSRSFIQATKDFFGGADLPYSKAKSDYVTSPLTDEGISTLLRGLQQAPTVTAICDSYGGAITGVADDATAFSHRTGTLFCIQYVSSWETANQTAGRLAQIRNLYAAMRPYVSGGAYVNYCDLDLDRNVWPQAYWGKNLGRLQQIKARIDPDNVFRHAQSVAVS